MIRLIMVRLCFIAAFLNIFNLAILGPHPLPIVSLTLCILGIYLNLRNPNR